jgi:type I restriction enzyme S subunit
MQLEERIITISRRFWKNGGGLKKVREIFSNSPIAFVVRQTELEGRWEVIYHHPKYRDAMIVLENAKYPLKTINDVSKLVKDGTHYTPKYATEGVRFLMVRNIKEDEIDFDREIRYISKEQHKELRKCQPKPNDVLLTKVGTIGIANVIPEDAPEFNIFVSVAKIEPKEGINPYFLKAFLNSSFGQIQMNRVVKGISQPDLHLIDIKKIKIPIPPRPIQDRIAEIMEDAYKQRKEKLKEAEDLLAGINDYVLDKLDIENPEVEEKKTFVVTLEDLKEGKRHDVFYYQPKYTAALSALENSEWETKPLKDIAEISFETRDPTKTPQRPFVYVEISDVDTKLGEITLYKELNGKEAPSRARMVIRKGDIVVSTTRPYRGAIAIVPDMLDDSIGSTGFAVLRPKEEINSLYLHTILRSKLCLAQLEQRMTGSNYPAITTGELKSIKIPVPLIEIQKEIATEVQRRRRIAKRMREEANEILEEAKKCVKWIILGGEEKTREIIRLIADKLKERYNPEKIILFGSYAWGLPNEDSDIDILVIKDTEEKPHDRMVNAARIISPLRRGYAVDIVVITPQELKSRLGRGDQFLQEVISRGEVLYG